MCTIGICEFLGNFYLYIIGTLLNNAKLQKRFKVFTLPYYLVISHSTNSEFLSSLNTTPQ